MSEKRFTSRPTETPTFHLFEVLDNNERLAIMRDIDVDKVVDLLNEQQTTISALKEENKRLHYQIIDLQDKLGMSEKVIDDD